MFKKELKKKRPVFLCSPEKNICSNGIEYFYFPSNTKNTPDTKVFIHGYGNDAFFDNYELFNLWHKNKFEVISINLPGHGADGSTYLNPENAPIVLFTAWNEIFKNMDLFNKKIQIVGESLGGLFALSLTLRCKSINSVHLLSPPLLVKLLPIGLWCEFSHFFGFHIWRNLSVNSFFGSIPAFYYFKRKQYPIRVIDQESNKIQVVNDTLKTLLKDILKHYGSNDLIVNIFHGKYDGIVPYQQSKQLNIVLRNNNINSTLEVLPCFHLSIKKWYCALL